MLKKSYENGVHRDLREGRFGAYLAMVVHAEVGAMYSGFMSDSGQEEEVPEKIPGFSDSIGLCRSLEEGLNFPVSDYQPWFPRRLDRLIFESTPEGSSVPMIAHDVISTCPRWLTAGFVAARAACSFRDGARLADALSVLDANERVVLEVCRWARARGVEATLSYLYPFCLACAETESIPDSDLFALGDESESEPATLGFHRLPPLDGGPDWFSMQPRAFRRLIGRVRRASAEQLPKIGQEVYGKLSGSLADVFWSRYRQRERHLARFALLNASKAAKAFVARIESSSMRELAVLGANLYRLQKGQVEGPALSVFEWSLIWGCYQAKKAKLAAHAPDPAQVEFLAHLILALYVLFFWRLASCR